MQNGKNPFGIVQKNKFHSFRKKSQIVCYFQVTLTKSHKKIFKLNHVSRKTSFQVNSSIHNLLDLSALLKDIYQRNAHLLNRFKIFTSLNNNKSQLSMPNNKPNKHLQNKKSQVNKKKLLKEKAEKTLIINNK